MLEIKKYDHYQVFSLNRPEVHNAFHPDLIARLTQAYKEAAENQDLQLIILKGEGKSFCAGADLHWMKSLATYSKEENIEDAKKLFDLFAAIYSCPLPTMAYAHGNVFGGAIGLLAACDIVIAETSTRFCFSEVKWGLSPATILPFVKTKIGTSYALELCLSAEIFDAKKAKQIRLVHKVVDGADSKKVLGQSAAAILENGREALLATKKLLRQIDYNPMDYREQTAKVIAERRVSSEGQEGLNYFLTKTMPKWKKPNIEVQW